MAFVLDDRIRENSTSTSTGAFTLAGAVTGYKSFGSRMSTNDTTFYAIINGTEWETGLGTYSGVNTLTRTAVFRSSNSDNAVNFSSGTKDVICDLPAFTGMSAAGKGLFLGAIGVEQVTTHGDSAYTILASDRFVATSAAFTAARIFTLPAANAVNAGTEILVADAAGGVTSTNTLSVVRVGSDTINGGTAAIFIRAAYGWLRLRSDGVSAWTITGAARCSRVTIYTSGSGTHTTLAGAAKMKVRGCGGGGGGANAGGTSVTATNGGNTTFGSLTGNGGTGGGNPGASAGGGGGSASGGDVNLTGGAGHGLGGAQVPGGMGGSNPFGGAGAGCFGANGGTASTNTGGGGGGGGQTGFSGGGGGGAGGYFEATFQPPSSTYSYGVGAAGTHGTSSNSANGGDGGSGVIIVEEDVL